MHTTFFLFQNQITNAKANIRSQALIVQQPPKQLGQPQMGMPSPKQNVQIVLPTVDVKAHSFTVPAFKPIPPAQERPTSEKLAVPVMSGIVVPTFNPVPYNKTQMEDKNRFSSNLATRVLPATVNQQAMPHISMDTIKALATTTNISVEAIEAAIHRKQQQLMRQQQQQAAIHATTTRRPTTTTPAPVQRRKNQNSNNNKVMNAPKEYYPVGYDKNFDDNFASRVDLPSTSFYCGDQKHFPGLYADEDLGCMVSQS